MSPSLSIQRLRARVDAGTQPVLARLALQSIAAELDGSIAGLAPQALLRVRRLDLQLPARALHRMPDAVLRQQLGREGRARLAELAVCAARPALGDAPDDAEAVLFADLAEMLACLARDALRARLDRWWWRDLLGAGYPDWTLAWVRQPQAGPAALGLLRADPVLALDAAIILRRQQPALGLEMEFWIVAVEVPAVDDATASRSEPAAPRGPFDSAAALPEVATPRPAAESGVAPTARIEPVRDTRPQLGSQQADAEGPGWPRWVHPPSLQASAHAPAPGSASVCPEQCSPRPAQLQAETGLLPFALPRPFFAPVMAEPAGHPQPAPAQRSADIDERTAAHVIPTPATFQHAPQLGTPTTSPPAVDGHGLTPQHRLPARFLISPHAMPRFSSDLASAPDLLLWPQPQMLLSRQARVLMLVNCLLGDGIYPDFTRPRDPGFPLSIWSLLPLLAEALIGPAARADPLWPCLSQRGQALPRRALAALADDWPLPVQSLRARRLRHAGRHSLQRWVAGYAELLRGRLQTVLGLPRAGIGQALQGPPARLWLSAAEIVVEFALDAHPVEWRLTGLDRDPGYLPSAGCSLRFRFD